MSGCFLGSYQKSLVLVRQQPQDTVVEKLQLVQQQVNTLPFDWDLQSRRVVFDMNQLSHLEPLQCNQTNINLWEELQSRIAQNRALAKADAKHAKSNWDEYAKEAALRTIRAFRFLRIPLIVAAGTLLGWYRQCAIITHTTDVDFYVPADYVVSLEHFHLIRVWP
jgi:hypothetical protein